MTEQLPSPTAIAMLYYDDIPAAHEWLSRVFGFETTAQHHGPDGVVFSAEMSFGASRIMLLGGGEDASLGMRSPRNAGAMTGGVYVTLDDVDRHYEHSVQTGATIVMPIQDMDYGSREYGALDCEGHYWSFGSYRPA
ncbi:VOC family protein [Nocardia sp. NPDC055053]